MFKVVACRAPSSTAGVLLSDDLLTIDPGKIAETQVIETIKEGRTAYRDQ